MPDDAKLRQVESATKVTEVEVACQIDRTPSKIKVDNPNILKGDFFAYCNGCKDRTPHAVPTPMPMPEPAAKRVK